MCYTFLNCKRFYRKQKWHQVALCIHWHQVAHHIQNLFCLLFSSIKRPLYVVHFESVKLQRPLVVQFWTINFDSLLFMLQDAVFLKVALFARQNIKDPRGIFYWLTCSKLGNVYCFIKKCVDYYFSTQIFYLAFGIFFYLTKLNN